MLANYHTHTWRCGHAKGTEREYVDAAIERGLEILGFSDHTPCPFPWYHHSLIRMKCSQIVDYVDAVSALRDEYSGIIDIRLGVEAEYYPAYFSELRSMLADHDIEYMILGQHFLDNEVFAHYCGRPTVSEAHLAQYCRQTRDAMQTGLFSCFAHPDLLRFIGNEHTYTRHMRGLCKDAKSCGMPLELNLLGLEAGKHYPNRRFWEIAAEEGCSVIFGCDTHDPAALLDRGSEEKAMELINELGLMLVERLELRPIVK